MKVSAMVASAMLMPPDADPVMPASTFTATASLTRTPGIAFNPSATVRNPGRAAITPPKPYSEAVLVTESRAPAIAALLPSANRAVTGFHAKATTVRIPRTRAPSTAHIATTDDTWVMSGLAIPGSCAVCVVP